MYAPDEGGSFSADGSTESAEAFATQASGEGQEAEHAGKDASGSGDAGEEPRERRAFLEGTGSELFNVDTVDYYYRFTLEDISLQLPCSISELTRSGWEILLPAPEKEGGKEYAIPPCSYEFFDAVLAQEPAEANSLFRSGQPEEKQIRICLANFTKTERDPMACTLCGISATAQSGVRLLTSFGAGTGSTLADINSLYGTDSSVYTLNKYADGTCTARYHFSNGLLDGDRIPVLAEAEDKSLAELLLIETGTDGATVQTLSLYYFRLPD